ncbi:uncharacterized protein Bfra_010535 [Botrytis fragariae]|uniref:Uncharacterized protein n=1 Tax=Botrytis fragariae TaxID=1964551 RepID=A0A8H6AHW4_9HELO|nr:uncharacterized protein Bfra_010535 [Botrytis fragariae]KAF5867560.1 hypothetical protein Bfra_010535 [Botrytis fragariae]
MNQEMKWKEVADAIALLMMKLPRMKQILNKSMSTDFEYLRKPAEYLGSRGARALGANTLLLIRAIRLVLPLNDKQQVRIVKVHGKTLGNTSHPDPQIVLWHCNYEFLDAGITLVTLA